MLRLVAVSILAGLLAGCSGLGLPSSGPLMQTPAEVMEGIYLLRPGMSKAEALAIVGPPPYEAGPKVNEDLARMGVELVQTTKVIGVRPTAFALVNRPPIEPGAPLKIESWLYAEPEAYYVSLTFRDGVLVRVGGFVRPDLMPAGAENDYSTHW
ncbi:MAG: hypothetical protein RIC55_05265 [Pirellulaceae bacterium]